MIKDKVKELGVYETMRKVHELGYGCVEVSQVDMNPENVAAFQKASADFGIQIAALSAALEPMFPGFPGECLANDFDKIVADCKTLSCNFVRIGILPITLMDDKDKIMAFIERCEAMAERLAEHGIELYYHNHHVEFVKYDGEFLLDLMKDNTSKIGFELDCHWIHRGGQDPVKFIKKYNGRITLLHLKDYRIAPMDLTGFDFKDMSVFMRKFSDVVQFAEVGEGSLDMKEIIEAGLESGSKFFLVEQDDCYGRDPFDSLKISADNLKKLGFADWF
ncbi:MAG: sugar phosphate isomerase/epimerase [Clostridia bacterium]|nr:sugar phosphate isomerase/epimerase [Clostridia bacterium]